MRYRQLFLISKSTLIRHFSRAYLSVIISRQGRDYVLLGVWGICFISSLFCSSDLRGSTQRSLIRSAQQKEYELSGNITDQHGRPLGDVNVYTEKQEIGTSSNRAGHFSLKLPKGRHTVLITYLGYQDYRQTITLESDKSVSIKLKPDNEPLHEIIISHNNKATHIRDPQMSVNKLSAKDIKKMPVVMGEPDPLKSLLTLPGVTNSGEASAGFNVRGGANDQNLILLDDAPIYGDSHLFGFFSVFNADAVNTMKLYKGGIPARYGGRISSVLDVDQVSGSYEDYHVKGGIGVISSKLKIEGPIENKKSSFVLAGRSSYAHLFLKLANNDNSAKFYDLNTRLNFKLNPHNSLYFSGYFGNDDFDLNDNFSSTFGNAMANLRWEHNFSDDLSADLEFFYSDYAFDLSINSVSFKWHNIVKNYGLNYKWHHYISKDLQLEYGVEGNYYNFNPGTLTPKDQDSQFNYLQLDKKYAVEPSVYIDVNQKISDKFNLRYGLRYSQFYRFGPEDIDRYPNDQPVHFNPTFKIYEEADPIGHKRYRKGQKIAGFDQFEPRVALSYRLDADQSFKLSYNRTTQYIQILSNFQGPIPTNIWTPSGPFVKPQLLDQYAFGYFKNFHQKTYSLETEVFYKDQQNKVDYVDGANLLSNNNIERVLLNGRARAYGLEVLLRKNVGNLTGWVAYTLSRAEQKTAGQSATEPGIADGHWYLSRYDKLHDLSITANYDYSRKWSFNVNFTLQSGQPATYPNGYYEFGDIHIPNFTNRNENRLPLYHHLDVSVEYVPKPKKKRGWQSSWVFSIYNIYNRKNAASMRFTTNDDTGINEARRLSIFGIIPSVSYHFKF